MYIMKKMYKIFIALSFFILSVQAVTSTFSNGNFNIQWSSSEGERYQILDSTNLITDTFQTISISNIEATPPENEFGIITDKDIAFYRVKKLLESGSFEIIQSWAQEENYHRLVNVAVPDTSGPFPVVIYLHGFGGSGNVNAINYLGDVIRVAPNGYLASTPNGQLKRSWNIGKEPSKAPDVDFIRQIIQYLKLHANVDANRITIVGSSNGGALLNRLMIELESNTFHQGVGLVSNMITNMFDGVNFRYDPSGNVQYNQSITPTTGRRMLTICGENDTTVPYNGGTGVWQNQFISAQTNTFIWARHMGYEGNQLLDTQGVPYSAYNDLIEYSYLDGDISHYKHLNKGHNAGQGPWVQEVIKNWIGY